METISFEDLGLDAKSLVALETKGFKTPTPIQALAIPRLLNGEANVIARARTGTGKTAAFGLPLVQTLRTASPTPKALILVPTRELALQVCKEISSFSPDRYPRITSVYGGQSMFVQLRSLKEGTEIVVGTPGRVKDHLQRGSLNLTNLDFFILDEADEMLDMGFIEDIETIFSTANKASRVLMFSATMPPAILKIAKKFMGDYEVIQEEVENTEPILTEQHFIVVHEEDKIEALVRIMDDSEDFYGLVFSQTKADADMISKALDEKGYQAAALHGDIQQNQREKILGRFRSKKTRILVATDVAARGIDIEGLTHVINFALPFDGPTYVHRIGRTGRAGAKGIAITFVRPSERRRLNYLRGLTKGDLTEIQIPSVKTILKKKREALLKTTENQISEMLGETISHTETCAKAEISETNNLEQEDFSTQDINQEEIVKQEFSNTNEKRETICSIPKEYIELAKKLVDSRDSTLVTAAILSLWQGKQLEASKYQEIRQTYQGQDFKNDREWKRGGRNDRFDRGSRSRDSEVAEGQTRLFIGLGRKNNMSKRDIAEFFSNLLGMPQRFVDNISVTDAFSLATLPTAAAKKAVEMSRQKSNLPHIHVDVRNEQATAELYRRRNSRNDFSRPAEASNGDKRRRYRKDRPGFGNRQK